MKSPRRINCRTASPRGERIAIRPQRSNELRSAAFTLRAGTCYEREWIIPIAWPVVRLPVSRMWSQIAPGSTRSFLNVSSAGRSIRRHWTIDLRLIIFRNTGACASSRAGKSLELADQQAESGSRRTLTIPQHVRDRPVKLQIDLLSSDTIGKFKVDDSRFRAAGEGACPNHSGGTWPCWPRSADVCGIG